MTLGHVAVLAVLMGGAGAAQAQQVRLLAPPEARQQLLEERPSYGGSVALIATGSVLATLGTGAGVFGIVMLVASLLSPNSLYVGIGYALGAMFALPGVAMMVLGTVMLVSGVRKLRAHHMANEQLEAIERMPVGSVGEPTPMVPVLIF